MATLTDCTISGNSAGGGGGLYNFNGTLTLANCTISGNIAAVTEAACSAYGTAMLTNCTVSGNSAPAAACADRVGDDDADQHDRRRQHPSQLGGDAQRHRRVGGSITGSYNLIGSRIGPGVRSLRGRRSTATSS